MIFLFGKASLGYSSMLFSAQAVNEQTHITSELHWWEVNTTDSAGKRTAIVQQHLLLLDKFVLCFTDLWKLVTQRKARVMLPNLF